MAMLKIHDLPVIGMLPTGQVRDGKPGFIILVDRSDEYWERYVVSLWFEDDKDWCNGHYTNRLDSAITTLCECAAFYSTEVRNGVLDVPGKP